MITKNKNLLIILWDLWCVTLSTKLINSWHYLRHFTLVVRVIKCSVSTSKVCTSNSYHLFQRHSIKPIFNVLFIVSNTCVGALVCHCSASLGLGGEQRRLPVLGIGWRTFLFEVKLESLIFYINLGFSYFLGNYTQLMKRYFLILKQKRQIFLFFICNFPQNVKKHPFLACFWPIWAY